MVLIPLRFHQQEDFNKEEESEDRASQFNHLCHLTNKHRLAELGPSHFISPEAAGR